MDWQPIETAPKDQTDVLVYLSVPYEGGQIFIARQNQYGDWSHYHEMVYDNEPLFYLNSAKELNITHWMPLPTQPTNKT